MLFTHRFGSVKTLTRARFWLNFHGFRLEAADPAQPESSRLAMNLGFSQASSAFALIDSIESTDPQGWPSFMNQAKDIHGQAEPFRPSGENLLPKRDPIHWYSCEDSSSIDPTCRKVSEYMLSRWE